MATHVADDSAIKELEEELMELANAQFESDGYKHLFEVPFTLKGCQEFFKQHAQFNLNRRDCWGYVQALAPLAIKRFVWDHETEELDGVPSRGGLNHYELAVKQGERHESQPPPLTEDLQHLAHAVVEVALTVVRGVADQEQSTRHAFVSSITPSPTCSRVHSRSPSYKGSSSAVSVRYGSAMRSQ